MKIEKGTVLIPTYEERENIGRLLDAIKNIDEEIKIIVIDDNSPDGTADIVRNRMEKHNGITLLERKEKAGLGGAYIYGISKAIEAGNEFIVTMDSDFSHDPSVLPHMFGAIKENDVIIGSRYIKGGGIKNWPLHRKIMSAAANMLLRLILNTRVKDSTSGYRCIRTDLLKKIDYATIQSQGYSFLYEMLFRMRKAGARIHEIPITFIDRRFGFTKISKNEIFKALAAMFRLRFSKF